MREYEQLRFDKIAETELPARERLFVARYDLYSAPRRAWYKFTPEMDLEKRFNVTGCPTVAFVPRHCNGFTEWCVQGKDPTNDQIEILGCENFKEQCTGVTFWNGEGSLSKWINDKVKSEGEPKISPFLRTYAEQGEWLARRERTTCNTHFRNVYMSQAFPAFAERGFLAMETPKEMQDWFLDFHKRHEKSRRKEFWDAESTQLSYHEVQTSFIDLDRARADKERMANEYIKPIVEKWSNESPLELTSFYGIREYPNKSWLRQHVDRIDTHVLSVTFTIDKRDLKGDEKPWHLQVTDWNGDQVRYVHPPGTMILYESSKLPHGRPEPNQSGVHLGAFMHFKPVNMHGSDAKKWDEIAKVARRNVAIHQDNAHYRSTASVEPKNPVFSEVSYGDNTRWTHLDEEPSEDDVESTQFTVRFKNEADRSMQLYWWEAEGATPVFQGRAWPGAGFDINTYPGHHFFWAEMDSEEPALGGKVVVDPGRTTYAYKTNLSGDSERKPSKWSKFVHDKIQVEQES